MDSKVPVETPASALVGAFTNVVKLSAGGDTNSG